MSKRPLKNNENGMVAIVITLVLMIVISLITLGFVQVTLRDQRQTLDRQLASQASYAAESGINLAKKVAEEKSYVGLNKTSCINNEPPFYTTDRYAIDAPNDVRITCLLVKDTDDEQIFQNVGIDSRVTKITDSANNLFQSITFTWKSTQSGVSTDGCAPSGDPLTLPTGNVDNMWACGHPILRVDLVPLLSSPLPGRTALNQANLKNSQFTAFFYPVTSGGETSLSYESKSGLTAGNRLVRANCSNGECSTTIIVPSTIASPNYSLMASNSFAVRMQSLYGSSYISVSATTATGQSQIRGQVTIDSTARAIDVVKRIQVRASSVSDDTSIDDALTTTGLGLCKQYFITATTVSAPANSECQID